MTFNDFSISWLVFEFDTVDVDGQYAIYDDALLFIDNFRSTGGNKIYSGQNFPCNFDKAQGFKSKTGTELLCVYQ